MASPEPAEDPLDLTSLDSESLFSALTAVEKVSSLPFPSPSYPKWRSAHTTQAVPDLLLDLKPILAHLSSPFPAAESSSAAEARDAVAHYVDTLDVRTWLDYIEAAR